MPAATKLTRSHRKFGQLVASGMRQTDAARKLWPNLARPDAKANKLMALPHVREYVEQLHEEALQELGVTRVGILKDLVSVKNRCMQAEPVLNRDGTQVLTETPDGGIAQAWTFNAKGAISALDLLGRHKRMWGEDKQSGGPPLGPGLTVIVQQGGNVNLQQNVQMHQVEVQLPRPG